MNFLGLRLKSLVMREISRRMP